MHFLSIFLPLAISAFLAPNSVFASYCSFPSTKNNTQVSSVINVAGTMDFQNARLTATSALRSSCDINGSANGKHIINIKDGGTVKNVILADPAKGIWCEGSCTLQNVYFEKVCYHAAGFASPGNGGSTETHQVIGGAAQNVPDKIFTQSSQGKTTITNFCAEKFSRVYRSCGSGCTQYTRSVQITNSKFKGPADSIVGLNKNRGDSMSISGITLDSSSSIKAVCQEFNEPNTSPVAVYKQNQDGTGTSCKYSKSSITIKS